MALAPGTRVGSYEVIARIGAGGMGEVYRARDAKLNRDVALKILPDAFMLDGDRIARFRREAQVLASLSHANIAAIYGFEDSGSTHALVLELVDGPTLADRIAEGPVPVDEALPIAEQIAEALEAAHEQGIIHRDLKPANIKLRGDGTVKVLDFGLAKALEPASAINPALTASPTITSPAMMTGVGMLLGTAAYMSPEQAKGRPADKRSDVWAFGCVLYEMLTGKRAFAGDDVVDIFAAVLRTDPDWNAIPVGVGERTRALLRRCLERDRNRRVSDASVVRFVLAEPEPSAPAAATSPPPTPWWRRLVSMAALLVIAGGVIGTVFLSIKRSPELPVTRFRITLPDGQQFAVRSVVVAVSPDGRRIAYAGRNGAASLEPRQVAQLYLRSLADADAHPIPGTNLDVMSPFFSPDGQWIGFYSFQDSTFKKVAVGGGAPVTICHADAPFGVTWDGEWIVFADQGAKGILRVSQDGGEPHVLVPVRPGEVFASPQILDHGRAILFTVASSQPGGDRWDKADIVIQNIDSADRNVVLHGGSEGRYVSTGHLLYMTGGTLMAVPLDRARHVHGGPVPIIEGVQRRLNVSIGTPAASLGVSTNGSLIYISAADEPAYQPRSLSVAARDGTLRPLPLPPLPYRHPRISPLDGSQLAVETDDAKEATIWIYDLKGGGPARRLTFGGRNHYPVWTPDGRRITFQSDRDGDYGIFWQLADGTAPAERLAKPDSGQRDIPEAWSPNGKILTFAQFPPFDYRVAALSADHSPAQKPLGDLPALHSAFSPDGKWLAYSSTEIGNRRDIFVQPFPPTGAKYQISTEGGTMPVWAPGQKQLYYWANLTRQFVAVDVRTEPTFAAGTKTALQIRAVFDSGAFPATNYDVLPNGAGFVLVTEVDNRSRGAIVTAPQAIDVVLNWFEELKQRVPVK